MLTNVVIQIWQILAIAEILVRYKNKDCDNYIYGITDKLNQETYLKEQSVCFCFATVVSAGIFHTWWWISPLCWDLRLTKQAAWLTDFHTSRLYSAPPPTTILEPARTEQAEEGIFRHAISPTLLTIVLFRIVQSEDSIRGWLQQKQFSRLCHINLN